LNNILTSIRSYKRLALKHSPQFLPNDPEALARWEKITKAYEILMNPDKRMFYDAHGETPRELEDFDLASLEEVSERVRAAEYRSHWSLDFSRL
jgi:DnaJ-class molecular chaperone